MHVSCCYHTTHLDKRWLKICSVDKNLGLLVDSCLNKSQECAQVVKGAKCILTCISNSAAIRNREVIFLLYLALYREHLKTGLEEGLGRLGKRGMIFWTEVLEARSHGVPCKVCVQQELWASALTFWQETVDMLVACRMCSSS